MRLILQTTIFVIILLAILPCVGQAKIIAVSTSYSNVFALDDNGTVWAWGWNQYGQLGNGATGDIVIDPQRVLIDNVTSIATNGIDCFALKDDGTVWAWGLDGLGKLGDGGSGSQSTPVPVQGLTNVIAISAANEGGYALERDGTVWAWGDNRDGELGNSTYASSEYVSIPVQVDGLSDIVALGEHGLYAIKSDGTVYAWGNNTIYINPSNSSNIFIGALGDLSGPGVRAPFQVQGISNARQITSGISGYTLYLKDDGTVWGWGMDYDGALGDGTDNKATLISNDAGVIWDDQVVTPPSVQTDISNVKQISTGEDNLDNSVVVKNDGSVWEWGQYVEGSWGGSISGYPLLPVQVKGLSNVVQVSAGSGGFDIALKDDGSVWGWGQNSYGVLRKSDTKDVETSPILLFQVSEYIATPTPSPNATSTPTPTPVSSPTSASLTNATVSTVASSMPQPSSSIVETHLSSPTAPTVGASVLSVFGNGLLDIIFAILCVIVVAGGAMYLFLRR